MLAEDEVPNRLGAARAAALEILDRLPNDRVGIIAFSGEAWIAAPLTVDHDALRETLEQLEYKGEQEEWLPRGGSDLARAVRLALEVFKETGQPDNALLILSDGEDHEGGLDTIAEEAADTGLTIFTAGFGTDEGAFIPEARHRSGKLHDREGNLVLTRLKSDALDLLARRTGGEYLPGSGRTFSARLERAIAELDRYEIEGSKRRVAIPRFQWFLFPSIVLFVAAMLLKTNWRLGRKPAAAALLALALAGLGEDAQARLIPRTAAEQAYADRDYQRALDLFEEEVAEASGERRSRLQLGEAAAAYRLANYRRAIRSYSGALLSQRSEVQEQAHYGLGNAHFFAGRRHLQPEADEQEPSPEAVEVTKLYWQDAIRHFDRTLAINSGNKSARHNRDIVQRKLDELNKEQEQQEQQDQDQNDQSQNQDQNNDENSNKDEQDPNQDPEQDPNEDPNQKANQDPEQNPNQDPEQQPGNDPPDRPDNPDQRPPEDQRGDPDQERSPDKNPANQAEAPRPEEGESPEEYARRILSDNADFRTKPVPLRIRGVRPPAKNW